MALSLQHRESKMTHDQRWVWGPELGCVCHTHSCSMLPALPCAGTKQRLWGCAAGGTQSSHPASPLGHFTALSKASRFKRDEEGMICSPKARCSLLAQKHLLGTFQTSALLLCADISGAAREQCVGLGLGVSLSCWVLAGWDCCGCAAPGSPMGLNSLCVISVLK